MPTIVSLRVYANKPQYQYESLQQILPSAFQKRCRCDDKTGRVEYRSDDIDECPTIRQQVDGVWQDAPISNQWRVPYDPYLLMKNDCHICVDIVTAASCVKYLFKYATKGADMAKARVTGASNDIEQYRSTRYISTAEARVPGVSLISSC